MIILGDFQTSVRRALEEIEPKYEELNGLVICGTHNTEKWDWRIFVEEIRNARENKIPFLGICWGHQLAAIEYAKNVLGITDATSEEFKENGTYVVKKRKEGLKVGMYSGESFWNNYEVDLPNWEKPSWFFTSQFHPEYESSKNKPHKMLIDFIQSCKSGNAR